jgi:hypothetical protein
MQQPQLQQQQQVPLPTTAATANQNQQAVQLQMLQLQKIQQQLRLAQQQQSQPTAGLFTSSRPTIFSSPQQQLQYQQMMIRQHQQQQQQQQQQQLAAGAPSQLAMAGNGSSASQMGVGSPNGLSMPMAPPQSRKSSSNAEAFDSMQRTAAAANHPKLPIFSQFSSIPPYSSSMTEEAFLESLARLMYLVNYPLKRIPTIRGNTPLPMLRLFKSVTELGGFARASVGSWMRVAGQLGLPSSSAEIAGQLQKLYASLLFTYEQVFFHQIPLDQVICTITFSSPC